MKVPLGGDVFWGNHRGALTETPPGPGGRHHRGLRLRRPRVAQRLGAVPRGAVGAHAQPGLQPRRECGERSFSSFTMKGFSKCFLILGFTTSVNKCNTIPKILKCGCLAWQANVWEKHGQCNNVCSMKFIY